MKPASQPWIGKWALVTGASSGIGSALAHELAAGGAHLVLTARRLDRLEALAGTLRAAHGVDVRVVQADLSQPMEAERIFAFTAANGLAIDVLVNNAGLAAYGPFHTSPIAAQLAMVQVHCSALLHLTHLYIAGMVERRRGFVLVVATTTLAPAPYMSTYAATKGFDLLFAEGLAEEVAHHGVGVTALCPAPTQSELTSNLNQEADQQAGLQPAQEVARKALQGLARGKRIVRPSFAAWIIGNLPRFLPRATVSGATEQYYRPKPAADSPAG